MTEDNEPGLVVFRENNPRLPRFVSTLSPPEDDEQVLLVPAEGTRTGWKAVRRGLAQEGPTVVFPTANVPTGEFAITAGCPPMHVSFTYQYSVNPATGEITWTLCNTSTGATPLNTEWTAWSRTHWYVYLNGSYVNGSGNNGMMPPWPCFSNIHTTGYGTYLIRLECGNTCGNDGVAEQTIVVAHVPAVLDGVAGLVGHGAFACVAEVIEADPYTYLPIYPENITQMEVTHGVNPLVSPWVISPYEASGEFLVEAYNTSTNSIPFTTVFEIDGGFTQPSLGAAWVSGLRGTFRIHMNRTPASMTWTARFLINGIEYWKQTVTSSDLVIDIPFDVYFQNYFQVPTLQFEAWSWTQVSADPLCSLYAGFEDTEWRFDA